MDKVTAAHLEGKCVFPKELMLDMFILQHIHCVSDLDTCKGSLHCVHTHPDQPVHDTGSLGTVYMPLLSHWGGRNTQIIQFPETPESVGLL